MTKRDVLLEKSPFDSDGGNLIGRDPRKISTEEWRKAGVERLGSTKAIRARCLDCCSGSAAEVRKCPAVECPSWPFRMGAAPKAYRALSPSRPKGLPDS